MSVWVLNHPGHSYPRLNLDGVGWNGMGMGGDGWGGVGMGGVGWVLIGTNSALTGRCRAASLMLSCHH